MLLRVRWIVTLVATIAVVAGLLPLEVEARERPAPRISLSVFQCPPGMTDATLATVDCTPLVDGFDVDIISIDGTQAKITVADGEKEGHVVRWEVVPSDAEIDNWGLKQTLLPPGSTQYLLQGEGVEFDPTPVYDYRFLTSEDDTQTDLSLYVFASASQGVIIPPSEAPTSQNSSSDAPTETPVAETAETPAPEQPTAESNSAPAPEGENAVATSTQVADAPVDTSQAASEETATDIETIAQDNVAIRLAADMTAVIVDTVSSGEVVDVLSGPIEAGEDLWYRVESSTDARGWVQAMAFEVASAAPANTSTEESEPAAPAATEPATPTFDPGDRAIVSDPPLNLREGPSADSDIVATLGQDQLLLIDSAAGTADGNDWYAVTLLSEPSTTGYVAAAFLSEIGFLQGETVEVANDQVNIRSQPSISADNAGTLDAGTTATIVSGPETADGYDWYLLLTDDNHSGWVAGSLLILSGTATNVPQESSDANGSVSSIEVFRAGAWVRVIDPPINLRTQPDPESPAIEALDENDPLVILSGPVSGGGYSWYLVDANGVQGYAAGEFLGGGFLPGEAVQVIDASVYLRTEPGVESDIVWSIDTGEIATVVSPDPLKDGEYYWILIRAETGETGYVAIDFIEPAQS